MKHLLKNLPRHSIVEYRNKLYRLDGNLKDGGWAYLIDLDGGKNISVNAKAALVMTPEDLGRIYLQMQKDHEIQYINYAKEKQNKHGVVE